MKDVASHAGVSTTTVSLFLNGRETVCSMETADKIRSAVADLNYNPSAAIRTARKVSPKTIGVCIPNNFDFGSAFVNSFLSDLWTGIAVEAARENYCLLHFPINTRPPILAEAHTLGHIEGLIMLSHDRGRASLLSAQGLPTLLLAASANVPAGCSNAYADESQTVHLALQHLWDLGHRRIAHIAGPIDVPQSKTDDDLNWRQPSFDDVAILRHNHYVSWMEARGVYDPELVFHAKGWFAPKSDEHIAKIKSLDRPVTAVFCANDNQAIEMIESARRYSIKVPEELSIVGVDDSTGARDCRPALTSVAIPVIELGRQGLRAMLNMVSERLPHEFRVKVAVSDLALRHSTAVSPIVKVS